MAKRNSWKYLAGAVWLTLLMVAVAVAAAPRSFSCSKQPEPTATVAAAKPPPLPDKAVKDLAHVLKKTLIQAMPKTLYEKQHKWGHTTMAANGITWRAKNQGLQPEIQRKRRNDGTWRMLRVTTRDLERTLEFDLRDCQYASAERLTFKVFLAFDAGVEFRQQVWRSGIRLYSGSTRARFRVKLALDCEMVVRMETRKESMLPDFIFRLRVAKSELGYDNLVVEHTAGIGGTGAKLLGDALLNTLKTFRPDLERDLIAKANAAVVKAADTREVRVSLGSLLAPKK